MGRTGAMGMAEAVDDGSITLEAAIHWQLTCNHHPPLPSSLIPTAMRAIAKARKGQWKDKVRMEGKLLFRGLKMAPVGLLIEALHLEDFV